MVKEEQQLVKRDQIGKVKENYLTKDYMGSHRDHQAHIH